MKKLIFLALAMFAFYSLAQDATPQPFNIRYIDETSLYQQYIVAQQYSQLQNKLKNDLSQAEKTKRTEIETFYNKVQNKYKKNLYKSQKAFEADQAKLQQMQDKAQKELETMQQNIEQQLNQEAQKLANEIDLFLADYAIQNNYDAILRKEASMFINPKWNVTDEVAAGLNNRYNAANAPEAKAEPEVDGNATTTTSPATGN